MGNTAIDFLTGKPFSPGSPFGPGAPWGKRNHTLTPPRKWHSGFLPSSPSISEALLHSVVYRKLTSYDMCWCFLRTHNPQSGGGLPARLWCPSLLGNLKDPDKAQGCFRLFPGCGTSVDNPYDFQKALTLSPRSPFGPVGPCVPGLPGLPWVQERQVSYPKTSSMATISLAERLVSVHFVPMDQKVPLDL